MIRSFHRQPGKPYVKIQIPVKSSIDDNHPGTFGSGFINSLATCIAAQKGYAGFFS